MFTELRVTDAIDPDPDLREWTLAGGADGPSGPGVDDWSGPTPDTDLWTVDAQFGYPGVSVFAFRFSVDGGRSFTVCDTNGGEFDVADAGRLVSEPPRLFISEIVRDTVHKDYAVEIYNGTGASYNLGLCSMHLHAAGGATYDTVQFPALDVAAGDTFVLCNRNATTKLSAACDWDGLSPPAPDLVFADNDVLVFECEYDQFYDVVGQLGSADAWLQIEDDPGPPITYTANGTLRRSCSVTIGDYVSSDPFDLTEWTGLPLVTGQTTVDLSDLGQHCP
jgi:hypothetical protein